MILKGSFSSVGGRRNDGKTMVFRWSEAGSVLQVLGHCGRRREVSGVP
jgi:hypothetical protein